MQIGGNSANFFFIANTSKHLSFIFFLPFLTTFTILPLTCLIIFYKQLATCYEKNIFATVNLFRFVYLLYLRNISQSKYAKRWQPFYF